MPQTWVANGAPGATRTRPGVGLPVLCSVSQSAASCQYFGMPVKAPGGVSRPVHASDVEAASAASTTIATATRLSASGWANARIHTRRGTLPGNGTRLSRCASPSTIGIRTTGSSLCTLRNGAPAPSRNVCT